MQRVVTYDPEVIQTEASRLYVQAGHAVLTWSIYGLLIGGAIGAAIFLAISRAPGGAPPAVAYVSGIVGLIVGYSEGQRRAHAWRLEAQRILVLAAIERNTRPTG